jgi:hypothetical protein
MDNLSGGTLASPFKSKRPARWQRRVKNCLKRIEWQLILRKSLFVEEGGLLLPNSNQKDYRSL